MKFLLFLLVAVLTFSGSINPRQIPNSLANMASAIGSDARSLIERDEGQLLSSKREASDVESSFIKQNIPIHVDRETANQQNKILVEHIISYNPGYYSDLKSGI